MCTVKNCWWQTEELSETCRVLFQNKFEKLVYLVGFIIRTYHDARSPERQFITMHGHMNVNLSRCTVTWTSIYHDAPSPERQFITMHGHLNVNLSRCTVTWTSIYHDAPSPERQFITMHGHLNVKTAVSISKSTKKFWTSPWQITLDFWKKISQHKVCNRRKEQFCFGTHQCGWQGDHWYPFFDDIQTLAQ